MWLLIWWLLEAYIIINFGSRRISRDTCKLTRICILINKKKPKNNILGQSTSNEKSLQTPISESNILFKCPTFYSFLFECVPLLDIVVTWWCDQYKLTRDWSFLPIHEWYRVTYEAKHYRFSPCFVFFFFNITSK